MLERLRDPTHTHTRVSAQGPGFGGAQMKAAAHQVSRAFVAGAPQLRSRRAAARRVPRDDSVTTHVAGHVARSVTVWAALGADSCERVAVCLYASALFALNR